MGQWFHARSGTLVEVDPAIAGGIDITCCRGDVNHQDVAEWVELSLASDPSGASFGTPNAQ